MWCITAKQKHPPQKAGVFWWQGTRDLNPQPFALEANALPIEPVPYNKNILTQSRWVRNFSEGGEKFAIFASHYETQYSLRGNAMSDPAIL